MNSPKLRRRDQRIRILQKGRYLHQLNQTNNKRFSQRFQATMQKNWFYHSFQKVPTSKANPLSSTLITKPEKNLKKKKEFLEKEDPISERAMKMKGKSKNYQLRFEEDKMYNQKEVEECINFELISETNCLSTRESRIVDCGIKLKVSLLGQKQRIPMDLVCVIDSSGSMTGKKAQLVRKSLRFLLKILNQDDRIALICFDQEAKILCPFLRNNLENKQEFKKAIKGILGKEKTNIEGGMEAGLQLMNNRKQKIQLLACFSYLMVKMII